MAMRNMWWHFRFLFGQTNFLSVRHFSKLLDRMSDKLSWIFDMSEMQEGRTDLRTDIGIT